MGTDHLENAAPSQLCAFDPNDALGGEAGTIRRAANGDLAAQRVMRDAYAVAINTVPADAPYAMLFGVEMVPYARICAASGDPEDARRLAGVLYFNFCAARSAGFESNAQPLAGEAIAILERLAEQGYELSSLAVVQLLNLNPTAGDIAKRMLSGGK